MATGSRTTVHPALLEAREVLELEQAARDAAQHDELRRSWRAIMLAPNIEVCEALIRGERVPLSTLDPAWVRRYGLRESP